MNAVTVATQTANLPVPSAAESAFNLAQRQALAMCNSTLVPAQYRGRDNLGNVMIAMEMANRIGAAPLQVMQNLHVIQGKPSLSSSFLIATVNACGRFEPLRFEVEGDDPTKDDYRVRAYAADKKSGDPCRGTWITWAMVKAEGWSKKPGSKWLTMPEQMFMYRAAAFWARLYAPEVSLGIHTDEEVVDVWGGAGAMPNAPTAHDNLKTLEAELVGRTIEGGEPEQTELATAESIRAAMDAAPDADALNDAADLIRELPEGEQPALIARYNERLEELDAA